MIKRFTAAIVIISACLFPSVSSFAAENTDGLTKFGGKVSFNGSYLKFDRPIYITENGRSLSPIRPLFDAMGVDMEEIDYDDERGILTASNILGCKVEIHLNDTRLRVYEASTGWRVVDMDCFALEIGEWVYVPLAAVCRALGAEVGYDDGAKLISVTLE